MNKSDVLIRSSPDGCNGENVNYELLSWLIFTFHTHILQIKKLLALYVYIYI